MTEKTPEALKLAGALMMISAPGSIQYEAFEMLISQQKTIEVMQKALQSIADTEYRCYSHPSRELERKVRIASSALSATQQEDSE